MSIYKHGGDVVEFAKSINCDICDVIDLSSNINFIKPNIDIDFNQLAICSYPNYNNLQKSIAKLYSVNINQMELFNGASVAISSLFRELDLAHVTLYSPCYLEYKRVAKINNYTVEIINRFEDLQREVKSNSLIIFVNPSTPDGKFYDIEQLLIMWAEKNCTIVIDESFLDFTEFESAIKYLEKYNKLYILKSMTKFYSSAGIRVGVLLSNSRNIDKIKATEPLWKLSEFDSHYIQSALKNKAFAEKSININSINREILKKILDESPLIKKTYQSTANYILFKLKNIKAKEFQSMLSNYKIMVRDCTNFDGLDSSYIRVAVKDIESIQVFETALNGINRQLAN